jgi:hypothetical protein
MAASEGLLPLPVVRPSYPVPLSSKSFLKSLHSTRTASKAPLRGVSKSNASARAKGNSRNKIATIDDLVAKSWTVYVSSPIFVGSHSATRLSASLRDHFKETKGALKHKTATGGSQMDPEAVTNVTVEFMREVKGEVGHSLAINIESQMKIAGVVRHQTTQVMMYNPPEDLRNDYEGGFPLVLVKGSSAVVTSALKWVSEFFDCFIRRLAIPPHKMGGLLQYLLALVPAPDVGSRVTIDLEPTGPISAHLGSISCSFSASAIPPACLRGAKGAVGAAFSHDDAASGAMLMWLDDVLQASAGVALSKCNVVGFSCGICSVTSSGVAKLISAHGPTIKFVLHALCVNAHTCIEQP